MPTWIYISEHHSYLWIWHEIYLPVAGWPGSAHDSWILSHALANFPSFPVPPKGKKKKFLIKGLLFASFLFALLFGFDNPSFVGKYYLVDSTELDTLSLLKEPHTIFQNFSIVLASSTREVWDVQFLAFIPLKCHWAVFWSLEAEMAYFERNL